MPGSPVVFWTGVLSYVNFAGAIHALAQASLLWVVRRGNRRANRTMAAFLVVLAIGMSHGVAERAGLYQAWPALGLLMGTLPLLYGPLFYFYVRAVTDRESRWTPVDALHGVPFVVGIAAYAIFFAWRWGPQFGSGAIDSVIRAPWQVVLVLTTVQTIVYVRRIRDSLSRHSDVVKSSYSTLDKVTLGWLRQRLTIYAVIWASGIVMMGAVAFEPRALGVASQSVFLLVALNTFATGYRAMLEPIFFGPDAPAGPVRRYERSNLTPENAAVLKARLLTLMEHDKPFLDPELTLPALAEVLGVQPAHLSRVINELLKQNFFEFINRYRVESARQRLAARSAMGEKLITVALECGFNSVSTFNRVFKDLAGRTPSDYRRHPTS
jgi:AraC-like DNA-binding protein